MEQIIKKVNSNKIFGGYQNVYSHRSAELDCEMKFGVFLPPQVEDGTSKAPVLYFLSGLTCTEQNFITKSGFQRTAAKLGLIVVAPDTSPRGCNIEDEDYSYDFGSGAGFYVDATEEKWKGHYRMYSYVTKELPAVINSNFPVIPDKVSICGHSMGGHGALICFLKNPGMYSSVSAFAPISNPSVVPWGITAFTHYLGSDQESWKGYDATELVRAYKGPRVDILIDQGKDDDFFATQLDTKNFMNAALESNVGVILRLQEGYDHSYYFISTYIDDHIAHHAKILAAQ